MNVSLDRFWDHDRLPPPGLFDPRDEAQFNLLALHLLELYWAHQKIEAFAAFCELCRDDLVREATRQLGDSEAGRRHDRAADGATGSGRAADLADELLAELFAAPESGAPRLLHLRAYARSRLGALAKRPASAFGACLAAVE